MTAPAVRQPPAPGIRSRTAWRITLAGRVQGVGFRPFVFRLARRFRLTGWVQNRMGQVEILAQGPAPALSRFACALLDEAPPLARPRIVSQRPQAPQRLGAFAILASEVDSPPAIHVPPDYFLCEDCRRELNDPADRRFRYPFINCTQCGPRYTLVRRLPYDRDNTTMAAFPLCPACQREYQDPVDRRFHAEPIACPACGPRLWLRFRNGARVDGNADALGACVTALHGGNIVAVKGIGGYHLMCDAANTAAVKRLRATKPRPHKPLAVMFPFRGDDGLADVRAAAVLAPVEAQLLCDPMRPIVLVSPRATGTLAPELAPGLHMAGVFLPYSPLHQLLLQDFGAPLVATSANVRGEPVLTEQTDVETRLARVADCFLHHDRPIARPADDPVYRVIAGRARPARLGRGVAPLELALPVRLDRPVLAVGGHLKNTVALGWDNRVVVSPHVGDLDAPRGMAVFEQVIGDLQSLYGVRAEQIACDAHPGYTSTRYAERLDLPVTAVFHHHAHASAIAGEFGPARNWLVFTWDGVGYGEDGTLWGGEALLGRPGAWRRVASLRPFRLPGGEKAARAPWRSAIALCWEAGLDWKACPDDTVLLKSAWARRLNAPTTTAVGRLFDAAAALTGLNLESTYEGQGPMVLESACEDGAQAVRLPLRLDVRGIWRTDWAPLLPVLLDDGHSAGARAAIFHESLARALVEQARRVRRQHGEITVGLSGGVFQNRRLAERALELLRAQDTEAHLGESIPCNDAGLSYGQIIECAARALRP